MIEFGEHNECFGIMPPDLVSCREIIGEDEPSCDHVIDVISANPPVIVQLDENESDDL